jgi:catechol 2,3-dioxygenase-like lactoylglutathione lyase family enzyme
MKQNCDALGGSLSINQFLHATLLVSHLESAQHFYEAVLGLEPIERDLSFAGAWYQIGAVQLHLIVTDAVIGDRVNPQKWGRNRHLAFAVTNLDAMKLHIEACGCCVQMSASGRAALFVSDPDDNLIELTQI